MTLYFIGLGLDDEKDITIKGLEAIKKSKNIFLEGYTSLMNCSLKALEKLYGKKITVIDREGVETKADIILKGAKSADVAFLVAGDPFSATTHMDLFLRAHEKKIKTKIIHNASILNAIGQTGLQLYKFGKTTSVVFPEKNWMPHTPYDTIKMNQKNGLHTLCLLDIKVKEQSKENMKKGKKVYEKPRFMTIKEAIDYLLKIEGERKEKVFSENSICIGCARLGSDKAKIVAGTAKRLRRTSFGKPLHSLIVPGKLHFIEEEILELFS